MISLRDQSKHLTLVKKFSNTSWLLIILIVLITGIGFSMLYSVSGGSVEPWLKKQIVRFAIGFIVMMFIAYIDVRIWFRLSYPIYVLTIILLIGVELFGSVGMGAQRWINFGLFNLQPSELMKIALVIALARYFHGLSIEDIKKIRWLIIPALMILAPASLVLIEPDLGTALLLLIEGAIIFFIVGVRWWKFIVVAFGVVASIPLFWSSLHLYQQKRILTFFNPEIDPLGSGYHILQSKIALGSGGIWGKGFLLGTQSNLNFLPEKHTDFIFTTLAEEFGLSGGLFVLLLYSLVLIYSYFLASKINYTIHSYK